VVSIHSPPFLHLRHVERALEAGKAVLCDKPFGVSAHEAKTMTRMAREARGLNVVNFEFRFAPIRQQLKALIDDGTIGQPEQLVWQNFSSQTRHPLRPFNWMFDRSLGGGWLRTWGSHAIDTVAWLFGPVVARDARLFRSIRVRDDRDGVARPVTAEDGFAIRLAAGDVHVEITSSCSSSVSLPDTLTVLGSDGVVRLSNDLTLEILRPDQPVQRFEHDTDVVAGSLRRLTAQLRSALTDGQPMEPSFVAGNACAEVLDALTARGITELA
jgi:predicted dehydrogenase